ncbi:MAG: septal ring lytic transglycosylase RlpA family protein [Phenylobacterium sp.]|uniref:septal ring lytic transglycosylase RlpA family protein n=1 Tax=Phenylobacterium sp. TaxID=1871053 RepID=UPI002735D2CC|nr:septal ring lytic transglycosylase RlpA family protein [Phenylobacterium sp.]MDP3748123.1 septal ring lytic transglycosylase RlpA family protein [Phenylobacterium sp.]
MTRIHIQARSVAMVLVGSAALAACATPQPRYSARMPNGGPVAAGPSTGAQPNGAGGRYKVGAPYQVAGIWYVPKEEPTYDQRGVASWYGDEFHMKPTANGEVFDMNAVSAAHTTLPLPSMVEVTNLDNGKKMTVRVNDRGPFVGGRVIDLSREAARQLGFDRQGTANVRVRYAGPAELGPPDAGLRHAAYTPTPAPSSSLPAAPIAYTGLAAPTAVASMPLPPIASAPPVKAAASTSGVYRVQAGAFSDPGNAQRVADQLAGAGPATIEPVQRADGVTLYRVMLAGGADEGEAWSLRDRVASYGFAEARVVRPF